MIIGSAIPKYHQFFSRGDSPRFNPVTTWYWGYGGQEQVLVSSTGTPIISSQHERPRDEIISSRINSHRGTMIRQPDISMILTVSDQQNPCLSDSANPHDFNKTIAPRAQLQILQSQKLAGNVFFVTAYFSLWVQFKRRWLKFTVTEWSKLGFFWNCVAAKTSKVFSSSYTAPKVTATECYCFPLLEQGRWGVAGSALSF